ncbi:MAG: metallophosphoesterase [Burkholderiales bacterium]|nr:metallophosphoesterase [Burkholderiales bacterium]
MRLLPLVSLLLHAWIGWRLAPELGGPWSVALLGLLLLSALTAPLGLGLRRAAGRGRLLQAASRIGLVAIGLFSSLLVLTLLRDLGLLVLAGLHRVEPAWLGIEALRTAGTASAWAAVGVAAFATAWGFLNARRTAAVRRVEVPIAGLPAGLQGFTIAQLSDVHVGPTIRRPYVERVVAAVNALDADLVAITGDLVDGSVRELAPHVAPLADLRSREGTFFVTGNHEYYSGADAWAAELRRLGLTVLANQHVAIRRGEATLVLAGVNDFSAGHFDREGASDPRRALAGSPSAAVRLLLAHQPRSAEAAEAAGFDLQLSGHTHGGQFWPWNFLVRLQQPFTAGLKRWRRMWVYTSRGTGYWGPPKRFGAPSEITLLRLVAAPPEAAAPRRAEPRPAPAPSGA